MTLEERIALTLLNRQLPVFELAKAVIAALKEAPAEEVATGLGLVEVRHIGPGIERPVYRFPQPAPKPDPAGFLERRVL